MADEIQNNGPTFGTVSRIIELLEPLSVSDREHVLRTVGTWFRIGFSPAAGSAEAQSGSRGESLPSSRNTTEEEKFSNRVELSAKEFIFEKEPTTEAERVACLAYYLTHYQDTPHFKTVDLSRLNTEAAQRKLSNPAVAANNAMRDGFFVQAPKSGYKQLSAMGERFVRLLPNREAALQIKNRLTARRGKRGSGSRADASQTDAESAEA